jgi:hypothetical protein
MSSRDFDLESFDNDILITIEIIAFAWARDDAKKKKKNFFYKMINLYFLNDEENAQTFKKRKMKIIKSSRRSRIEKFKTMIWTKTVRSLQEEHHFALLNNWKYNKWHFVDFMMMIFSELSCSF